MRKRFEVVVTPVMMADEEEMRVERSSAAEVDEKCILVVVKAGE